MTDETQDATVLTQEQEQRTEAVLTASEVLRGRGAARTMLAPGEVHVPLVGDVIELAHYIYTGDPYSVFAARREQAENPLVATEALKEILGDAYIDHTLGDEAEADGLPEFD